MNKKQKIVIWIGVIIIVLTGFSPPRRVTGSSTRYSDGYEYYDFYDYYEHCWLFSNPRRRIEYDILFLEWGLVALTTGVFLITFNTKPKV